MRSFFRQPVVDVMACLERLVLPARSRRPAGVLFVVLVSLIVTWFVYVPIHELLHVGGCVWTGGEVTRLELSPRYGAAFLSKIFPFIVSGSDYAGQLKGFDTKGSDLCYLATDFLPFVLTILIGVPLVKLAGRKRRPILFGMAVVVGLAPFYNLPGDYFEMASIIVTRAVTMSGANPPAFVGIRSDDVFKLVGQLMEQPGELGLVGAGPIAVAALLIIVAVGLSILLAFATYWAGHWFSRLVLHRYSPSPVGSRTRAG